MKNYSNLLKIAESNNGYIFSKDIVNSNISKDYLKYAVQDGIIDKVARGIYVTPDTFVDNLYVFQKINKRVIFSAFTSAYLHDLTTRDNEMIFGATPLNYFSKSASSNDNVIVRESEDVYNIGITTLKTMFGNEVICHDIHRTVCDLFSPKYIGDKFVQVESLKNYLRRPDKDTTILMQYAKKLGVDKELREILYFLWKDF